MDEIKKNSVLIVDDDESSIMALSHILIRDYTIFAVKDGQDAIEIAEQYHPDVILLDILMPDMDGYGVMSVLKNSEKAAHIPVIFITGLGNADDEEAGLSLGAVDYISKPFSPAAVKLRIQNQIKILNQFRVVEQISMIDQLTSIPNRRGFDSRMDMEWIRAVRDNTLISILVMDLDNFKAYNDTYGHLQGDVALQVTAKTITESFKRPGDFVARLGGEEFVALLPDTDLSGALHIAEKICLDISSTIIPCTDGTETKLTISVGVNTQAPWLDSSRYSFVSEADKALYKAKKSGKGRACSSV